MGGGLQPLAAGDADNTAYAAFVKGALAFTRQARAGDSAAAQQAIELLIVDGVETQPDIVDRLSGGGPTDLSDAERGLTELQAALLAEAATPDPAAARAKLQAILAEPRYQAQQPSLFDQAVRWVFARIGDFFRGLGGLGRGPGLVQLVEIGVAAALLVALVLLLARSNLGRGRAVAAGGKPGRRLSADRYFEEADRLAAAGDFSAALRTLTSGVATRLGGPGAWEYSPLTVRELFRSRHLLEPLRPLLVPFETSIYGHRVVDAATYRGASAVAAPYRHEADQAQVSGPTQAAG